MVTLDISVRCNYAGACAGARVLRILDDNKPRILEHAEFKLSSEVVRPLGDIIFWKFMMEKYFIILTLSPMFFYLTTSNNISVLLIS